MDYSVQDFLEVIGKQAQQIALLEIQLKKALEKKEVKEGEEDASRN